MPFKPKLRTSCIFLLTLLGGSWVVINGVISHLIWVITIVTLLITPLLTTPETPSKLRTSYILSKQSAGLCSLPVGSPARTDAWRRIRELVRKRKELPTLFLRAAYSTCKIMEPKPCSMYEGLCFIGLMGIMAPTCREFLLLFPCWGT